LLGEQRIAAAAQSGGKVRAITMTLSPQTDRTPIGVGTRSSKTTLAFRALVCFSFLYFVRPEDFVPGLSHVPIAKIAGGLSVLALVFGMRSKERGKLPLECKILLALLGHMILSIPFAYWRGGAFDTVVNKFSKGVIAALLIVLVVSKVNELRKLLYIQTSAVAAITVASLIVRHTTDGRLMGIQKGMLENPNDLAINIAINFPLCLAFMFAAKGALRKMTWLFGLGCMLYAVVATYSRSGMVAMLITGLLCLWEFGVRGRRIVLLFSSGIAGIIFLAVVLSTPSYLSRMETLIHSTPEGSRQDGTLESYGQGSVEAREELLKQSVRIALQHPIFGVGAGNFVVVGGTWHVAHNTYTEIAAEAGFPGIFLFFWMLGVSLQKIRRVRTLPAYSLNVDIRLWTSALWAAMGAYLAGAAFASTQYNLFPYFMVGYIGALYKIAASPNADLTEGSQVQDAGKGLPGNVANRDREVAWAR